MFHDRARIEVLAGRGGDGGLSFRREKHVPKGGPDGGDGGRGGDVVLVADDSLRDLSSFRAKTKFKAGRGEPGRGARKHGADGATIELAVPVGTQAYGTEGELIADLARPDARVVLARGGQGGRGNARFATPVRQTPRFAEVGEPAEEAELELRLKLLADAAMVGLPNAGKSSLLRRHLEREAEGRRLPVHDARAGARDGRVARTAPQLTVADVPGLIEGASEGVGLGHEFLAHLERARLLLHVIDASEEDVEERFRTIDTELSLYGAGLDERPQAIVLNKIDLLPEPPAFPLEDERVVGVFPVSCATGAGIDELQARALPALSGRTRARLRGGAGAAGVPRVPAAAAGPQDVQDLPHRPWLSDHRRGAAGRRARGGAQGRRRPQGPGGRDRRGDARVAVTVGILGGRFDPPHLGHVALAEAAVARFGIDDLHVTVVADAAHKPSEAPVGDRLAMAELAFSELDATVELEEHRYTVDALEAAGYDDPIFLVGADQLAAFPTWKDPERVLELARLGVATRPGYAPATASPRIQIFELEPHPVSSSEIRRRALAGEPLDGLVAPAVARYIEEHGLYRRA